MDWEIDIPRISGVRGKLPNYKSKGKRDAKKIGNRRVRAGIRQALRSQSEVKVRGITAARAIKPRTKYSHT